MKFFFSRNLLLRTPMFLVYLTLFVVLSISAFMVITRSQEIIGRYNSALETVSVKMELLLNIRENADQIKTAVRSYVVHSDSLIDREREKSVYSISRINRNNWSLYKGLVKSNEERAILDSLLVYEQQQSNTWDQIFQIKQAATYSEISDTGLHILLLNPAYALYQNYITKLSNFIVKDIRVGSKKNDKLVLDSRKIIIFFTFFSYCLLLFLGVLIWKAINELQNDNNLLIDKDKQIGEQKVLFEGILTAAPDGIIGVNESGQIIFYNRQAEALFGYSSNEIIGQSPEKLFSFKFENADWFHINECFAVISQKQKADQEHDLHGIKKSGEVYPVDISLGKIQTEQGVIFILVVRDVTIRKRAKEQLKEKNDELKKLSAYLQNVREEERKYLAREVHDELGQLASALKIDVDWLGIRITWQEEAAQNRIAHANKIIEVMITAIRGIASRLRPSILDDFGLNAALQWHCAEFQKLNGIPCIFECGFNDNDLAVNIKTELFRMAQESMTNVMRHAKAGKITISTKEDGENIYMTVTDDGQGFDLNQQKNTLGLIGLRERAASLKGKIEIESSIGKGTSIHVIIPKNCD